MPAKQRGSVDRHGRGWRARWLDESGARRSLGGFETKTAAADYLETRVKEVALLRRGDLLPAWHRPQTVSALLDMFLERHGATVDPATEAKLRRQLKHAAPRSATGTQTR